MAKAPLGTVLALLLCSAAAAQQTADLSARLLDPFAFRHIGPIGNRVSAVAGVPGDEGGYYAGAALIAALGHAYGPQERDEAGRGVFRTTDGGATWTDLAAGLPRGPLGNVHCIREDPEQPGLLFLGAENALWVSFDDGAAWRRLSRRSDGGGNLPPAPVHWIEVQAPSSTRGSPAPARTRSAGSVGSTRGSPTSHARSARPTRGRPTSRSRSGDDSNPNSPSRRTVSRLRLPARWRT